MGSMEIYDTTLRDGTQSEHVNFTLYDKLKLAKRLDSCGFDYIELGWPASKKADAKAFDKAREMTFSHARIVAFGMTRKKGLRPEQDENLEAILKSGAGVAAVFGKTWEPHIREQLRMSPEENLAAISESVSFLREQGLEVFYDAEHFFDGFNDNANYAIRTLEAARNAGASRIILCDTNGGTLPLELRKIVSAVHRHFGGPDYLGIHAHNDSGCAVANSVIVSDMVRQVQGTVNGFGERTGNADLMQVIPNLILKNGGMKVNAGLDRLKELSDYVYTLSNNRPNGSQPYVGRYAFSHKGGVHVDAINKGASYEHIDPEIVGNKRHIVLSDLSGSGNFIATARRIGFDVDKRHPNMRKALSELESMERRGYDIRTLEAEHYLLVKKHFTETQPALHIDYWKILSESREGKYSEAVLSGRIDDKQHDVLANEYGKGPVAATFKAAKKLIRYEHGEIDSVKLSNFKVRIAEDRQEDSSVRVYVEMKDNGYTWGTVGVSVDILEASLEAVKKGFEYYLLRKADRA